MQRFTVLSGCSGGGKSTILEALAAQGFATVPEPGRRIVSVAKNPLSNLAFAQQAIALSLQDWEAAQTLPAPVFFDRGLVDATAAYAHATGSEPPEAQGLGTRYGRRAFLVPPWPEIYQTDRERQHGFPDAVAEYDRLCVYFPLHGYEVVIVPKAPVPQRVAFILSHLA